jgi:hypothetical protein
MKAEHVGVRTMERQKRVIAAAKTLESLQRSILRGGLLEGTMVFLQ